MQKKVWINIDLYKIIIKETSIWTPLETGGVLMGYLDSKENIVVDSLVGSGPKAVRKEYLFKPDTDFQNQEIERIYLNSNGVISYLGDWHSHPNGLAYLSALDKKTLKKIAKWKGSQNSNPIFIIFGTKNNELRCWQFNASFNSKYEELIIKVHDITI